MDEEKIKEIINKLEASGYGVWEEEGIELCFSTSTIKMILREV